MKDRYDFSKAKRGAVVPATGKTRITIYVDTDLLDEFRAKAAEEGKGYQTLINETLRQAVKKVAKRSTLKDLDEETLRRVIREEIKAAA